MLKMTFIIIYLPELVELCWFYQFEHHENRVSHSKCSNSDWVMSENDTSRSTSFRQRWPGGTMPPLQLRSLYVLYVHGFGLSSTTSEGEIGKLDFCESRIKTIETATNRDSKTSRGIYGEGSVVFLTPEKCQSWPQHDDWIKKNCSCP